MAYTTDETAKINELTNKFEVAESAYTAEADMNGKGHAEGPLGEQRGFWYFPFSGQPTDRGSFYNWLALSDASLATKKTAYDSAKLALDNYKKMLADKYINNNPDVAIAANAAEANATAQAQADVQKNLDNKKFMQGTTKYLIIGAIVITIIIAGVIIYRRKFKS